MKLNNSMHKKNTLLILAIFISSTCVYSQCDLSLRSHGQKLLKRSYDANRDINEQERDSYISTILAMDKFEIERVFDIEIELEYYEGEVAFASPNCKSSSCDGNIGLGFDLLLKLLNLEDLGGKWMFRAILYHEAAHVFQFKNNLKFENTVHQEIHADLIAGWYLGKQIKNYMGEYDFSNGANQAIKKMYQKEQSMRIYKSNITMLFGLLGDINYNTINHHGNYTTRAHAIHDGMDLYTGYATPVNPINGESRDYKKILMTQVKNHALSIIKDWDY